MNWLQKIFGIGDQPYPCTRDIYRAWESETKKARPLGYFLAITLPEALQSHYRHYIYHPIDNLYRSIRNRVFFKYYLVDTGLNRYHYYDKDELMLHASFNILKDFVEIELAWMEYLSYRNDYPKRKFSFRRFRDPEMGEAYLSYWLNPTYGEDDPDPDAGMVEKEIKYYTELKALYGWWVHVRPNRVDPFDSETLSDWGIDILSSKWKAENLELSEKYSNASLEAWEIEAQYDKEDQEMLHRLIDVRRGLWT